MAVPIVRPTLGGDLMPREIVADIFSKAERQSVIQQIAQRQPLSSTGAVIPVVTGTPSAGWVGEAGRKPVSDMTLGSKLLEPKKLAVIVPFSKEYLRDTSIDLLGILRPKIAEAFAVSFDAASIKGTSTPFADFIYETTNVVEAGTNAAADGGLHQDLVEAIGAVADEGKSYRVSQWVFDDTFEVNILGARDTQGNPTFLTSNTDDGGPVGRILGRPVRYSNQAATGATAQNRGFGVDASQMAYGISQDIQYDISNQASIELADGPPATVLHLWQNNLVALLAETELAFVMNDVQAAVRVADATPAA
jgi:HK97 family phage major capsid protein